MATTKLFECSTCEAEGKITIKGDVYKQHDIVNCPICAADISNPDDDLLDDE